MQRMSHGRLPPACRNCLDSFWLQHIGLAGIMYNLTVAVGLAVCYNATHA